jgi:hypothetical protein
MKILISIAQWISKSLQDKEGKTSATRMTAFTSSMVMVFVTFLDQCFGKPANMDIFLYWFCLLVVSLGFAGPMAALILAARGIKKDETPPAQ